MYCLVMTVLLLDFLGNFRSTVLLVSSAPGFVSLPCITPSSAALETLFPAQNILRNTALLRFPRKSVIFVKEYNKSRGRDRLFLGFFRYVQKRFAAFDDLLKGYQNSNGFGSPHPQVPTYCGITLPQFGQVHVPLFGTSFLLLTAS